MAINSGDFVDGLLDHQARVNFAMDSGDINTLVEDYAPVNDPVGVGSTEAITKTTYTAPHHWGDGHSFWGFVQWGN
jgi:hypothetical protein